MLFYDTENYKNPLAYFNLISSFFKIKELIYLPAGNSLKYLFPIIYLVSKILRFNVNYFVIGGWLPNVIARESVLKKKLIKIKRIYVETRYMHKSLMDEYQFQNVFWFPNFRFGQGSMEKVIQDENLRLVFMSRINHKKGIKMIIDFAKETSLNISIDFYGPVNPEDKDYFEESIRSCNKLAYKGVLLPTEIQQSLSDYDMLLLPTQYYTEGLPGAIVDAYFAGIPVLVTKWQSAEEFVDDRVTGFIIPFENGYEQLKKCIEFIYSNRQLLDELKKNAWKYSKEFSADVAWDILTETMMG